MSIIIDLYRNAALGNRLDGAHPLGDGVPTSTPDLFYDSFESQDMSAPSSPLPALNTKPVTWGSNNATSVVTMNPGPTAVYNNGVINNPASDQSKDWSAHTGDYSLRFRFAASPAQIGTGEVLAEQRWALPLASGESDFWIRYQIRVPTNYVNDLSNANSKFLAMWMNDYTTSGAGAVWNMRPKSDTGSTLHVSYANGNQIPSTGPSGEVLIGDLINIPADRGKWIQMVMRFKSASSNGANDGEIRTYYKKEGESSFTEMTPLTGLNTFVDAGLSGIRGGYFLGSHRGYQDETEWLIDVIEMSTGSLL